MKATTVHDKSTTLSIVKTVTITIGIIMTNIILIKTTRMNSILRIKMFTHPCSNISHYVGVF